MLNNRKYGEVLIMNAPYITTSKKVKPFLRWAGGKRWLIKQLDDFLPDTFNQYHEPFIGGGAIFFHLNPRQAFISDFNAELIETYNAIKNNPY